MDEESNRAKILKAASDRAQQSEERYHIQMVADAIGERRNRDLLDILSQSEQDSGWSETVRSLAKAQDFFYSLPIGSGRLNTQIERLKFREILFLLLRCGGLEPVAISTDEILKRMEKESSLIDACVSVRYYIESVTEKQVKSGDVLFFNSNEFGSEISKETSDLIDAIKQKETQEIILEECDSRINIAPLWHCEIGRSVLSELGISGYVISSERFNEVLSVIQFPISVTEVKHFTPPPTQKFPSHEDYRNLHEYIIKQDTEGLCRLSSKHSLLPLQSMLEETLDLYTRESSSDGYRRILNLIHMQVRIRTEDSIQFLEALAHLKEIRISTVAITALGNYYHESAAAALVELLCKSRNREIVGTAKSATLNIGKKCPETYSVIESTLNSSDCKQRGRLRSILRELGLTHRLYY